MKGKLKWIFILTFILVASVSFLAVGCSKDNSDSGGGGNSETSYTLDLTPDSLALTVGETGTLSALLTPADDSESFDWRSKDESIAAVDNSGVVTAISPGTTVVSVSAKGLSKQCTIVVNQREVEEIIVFDRERIDLFVGDLFSYEFSSTVADNTVLTFVSSLPEVAEVSESATVKNGKASMQLKALTCGETTISVNFNGKTANILLRVSNEVELYLDAPEEIVASSETPYKLNWSLKINGEPKENSENIIWTSSNESVAAVTDGMLTAKAYGDVTISLAYQDEYTERSESIDLEIYNGIDTVEEFMAMRSSGKAERYALTSDIDFNGEQISRLSDTKWSGVFNGNGYTLKNFVIGDSENGLFPYMQAGSSVCNLAIVGAEVSASSWGGVVTNRNDGTISDIYLEVRFTNASTSVNGPNGGIAARNVVNTNAQTAVIKNCIVVADASPSLSEAQKKTIGAVVGYQMMKPLENCYAIALAGGIELRNRRGVDTAAADCNDSSYFTNCRLFVNAADAYEFDFSQDFGENWDTERGKLPMLAGWQPKAIGNSLGYNSVKMGAGNTLTIPFTAEGFYSVYVQTDATGKYTFENSVLKTESELPNGTKFTFTAALICDRSVTRTFSVEIGKVSTEATFAPVNMASEETDLVLPFNANSVDALSIGGIAVNDYTFADNEITIKNYKSVLGITDIGVQAGEKEVTILSDGMVCSVPLLFATAVITQADLTEDKEAQSFSDIVFGQNGYIGYFVLGSNLDLNAGNVVSPNTSNTDAQFAGIFDGRGYSISNYKVSANYKALFGNLAATGEIKNLKVSGAELSAGTWLGSVVCRNYGTISDVYAVYSVTSAGINNNNPAGLVARNDGTMRNCIAEVTTDEGYANKGSVGAIAGYSSVTSMTNCYAIVNDASVGIMNGRGTTPSDKVPTCKAYVGKSAFFAAYEKGEADTSAYSEYWHFDREKETIIFGA